MYRHINQIGTASDTIELHDKLHQVQHYSNQLAKETSQHLKDLSHLPTTQSEQREHRLQQERLVNSFTAALNSFQMAQRRQKDKESGSTLRTARGRGAVAGGFDAFAGDGSTSDKLIPLDSSGTSKQQQQQILAEDEDEEIELLRDREQSLRQLESDIMDVNQIFKDLSVLVHEQGDIVDSIEANMERSALNVERGTEQLLQARNYQAKVRRRKFCILIIVLVVVAIIAIIIAVSVSSRQ
jgi:Tfp pilus assembly protein PilE